MNVDTGQFAALRGEVDQLRVDLQALKAESFAQGVLLQGVIIGLQPPQRDVKRQRPRHLRAVEEGPQ